MEWGKKIDGVQIHGVFNDVMNLSEIANIYEECSSSGESLNSWDFVIFTDSR